MTKWLHLSLLMRQKKKDLAAMYPHALSSRSTFALSINRLLCRNPALLRYQCPYDATIMKYRRTCAKGTRTFCTLTNFHARNITAFNSFSSWNLPNEIAGSASSKFGRLEELLRQRYYSAAKRFCLFRQFEEP